MRPETSNLMSNLADWFNSAVRPKSELEKEMEEGTEQVKKKESLSWGFIILCLGGAWALFELIRAILFFY